MSPPFTLKQLVDFHETQREVHPAEGDLDTIIFNLVPSTVPKWRTFRHLTCMKNWHQSTWKHEGLSVVTVETTPLSFDI
jgi:hypothetical protein